MQSIVLSMHDSSKRLPDCSIISRSACVFGIRLHESDETYSNVHVYGDTPVRPGHRTSYIRICCSYCRSDEPFKAPLQQLVTHPVYVTLLTAPLVAALSTLMRVPYIEFTTVFPMNVTPETYFPDEIDPIDIPR